MMSRIVIVILIYHRHKPIDSINLLGLGYMLSVLMDLRLHTTKQYLDQVNCCKLPKGGLVPCNYEANVKYILQEKDGDSGGMKSAPILVHKLVSVLESIEKLPVYLYDTPGSGYGLQVRRCWGMR
jgi:hypothetical protein